MCLIKADQDPAMHNNLQHEEICDMSSLKGLF